MMSDLDQKFMLQMIIEMYDKTCPRPNMRLIEEKADDRSSSDVLYDSMFEESLKKKY